MLNFTRASALLFASVAAHAADPAKPAPIGDYVGIWKGECAKDPRNGFPTQDLLVVREGGMTQYSLSFKDRKECDQPNVTTRLEYKGTLATSALKKGAHEFALQPQKIELAALNAAGALWLIEKKECEKGDWTSRASVDCTQKEPYKTFIMSQKFRLLFNKKAGKLEYFDVSDGQLEPKAKPELFTKVSALPFDLDKLP